MLPPGSAALRARLLEAAPEGLAAALVSGLRLKTGAAQVLDISDLFEIPPLPNWCFQRDPQIVIGAGVVFSSMTSAARERETRLARALFRFHPDLSATPVLHEPIIADFERSHVAGAGHACLEGGDVVVLSPDLIAVGLSERTNRLGIDDLAAALATRGEAPRFMVVVELPRRRAYMHLDTLFSPIDREMALVFPPVILQKGSEKASVYEIDLRSKSRNCPFAGWKVRGRSTAVVVAGVVKYQHNGSLS
jgi:arginine deiminase